MSGGPCRQTTVPTELYENDHLEWGTRERQRNPN